MKQKEKLKKTEYVQARIDPVIKKKTEHILHKLGISPSQAINMLYYQIYIRGGIPFELTLPEPMTEEEEKEVAKAREQIKKGHYIVYDLRKHASIEEALDEGIQNNSL